ncbi:MAG: hypothetical protein LBC64_08165 [Fibromonadaceae bacterium]|nr:hypothetical protein [Fibromonadaceae bacterium]
MPDKDYNPYKELWEENLIRDHYKNYPGDANAMIEFNRKAKEKVNPPSQFKWLDEGYLGQPFSKRACERRL